MQDEQQEPTLAQIEQEVAQNSQENQALPNSDEALVSWTASEYIAHHKSPVWYIILGIAIALASSLIYLFTRDTISSVVVVIAGTLFGTFASRKPEVRKYEITPAGLRISEKLYSFDILKSFALHDDGGIRSIFVIPIKRFMPGLTIYFPPDQEDEIIETLNRYLPIEEGNPDAIDRLMRKVRF